MWKSFGQVIRECISNHEFYRLHKKMVETNSVVRDKILAIHGSINIEISRYSRMLTYMKTSGQVKKLVGRSLRVTIAGLRRFIYCFFF